LLLTTELKDGNPNLQWLVTDQLGTPRLIFDKTGSLAGVKHHDYLPFGEELFAGTGGRTATMGYTPPGNNAADGARQKFTQKERDIETGLDYFGARYYSSTQGRFTSPDELTGGPHEIFEEVLPPDPLLYAEPTEPESFNKYDYCLGNPLRYVDPDGHQTRQADALIVQPVPVATALNILIATAKAVDNMARGINNLEADFGMGNQRVPLHRASNMTQGMTMVVVEDLSVFGGLLSGKPQAGVMMADTEESAVIAAEVGNATRGVKSTTQMAAELSHEIGKNSVSYRTPNKVGHIDLKGKSHFDKPTQQSIPTPHVQERVLNRSPGGVA
jgi:RHS repeat-associated protein